MRRALALTAVLVALAPCSALAQLQPGPVLETVEVKPDEPFVSFKHQLDPGTEYTIRAAGWMKHTNSDGSSSTVDALYCYEQVGTACGPTPSYTSLGLGVRVCPQASCPSVVNYLPLNYFSANHEGLPADPPPPYTSAHDYSVEFTAPSADVGTELQVTSPTASDCLRCSGVFLVDLIGPPNRTAISVRAKFEGVPKRGPKDLISLVFELKGKITRMTEGNSTDAWPFRGRQRFSAAVHMINEGLDDVIVFKALPHVAGRYADRSGGRAVLVQAVVTRSTRRGCRVGARLMMLLSENGMTFYRPSGKSTCRGLDMYMSPNHPKRDDFSLKIRKLES